MTLFLVLGFRVIACTDLTAVLESAIAAELTWLPIIEVEAEGHFSGWRLFSTLRLLFPPSIPFSEQEV